MSSRTTQENMKKAKVSRFDTVQAVSPFFTFMGNIRGLMHWKHEKVNQVN